MKLTEAQRLALAVLATSADTDPVRVSGGGTHAGGPSYATTASKLPTKKLVQLGLAKWVPGYRWWDLYATATDAGRQWLAEHPEP